MKKLTVLLLAFALLLSLAACKPEQTPAASDALPPAPTASLSEAIQNTIDRITEGKTFTVTLNGHITDIQAYEKGLLQGEDQTYNLVSQVYLDVENQQLTVYNTAIGEGEFVNTLLHDGWEVTYDSYAGEYYKEDVSENVKDLFEANSEEFDPDTILEQIPEDELEMIEEVLDIEKLVELLGTLGTEKFADEQWLEDTFGYTAVTEGHIVTHSYTLNLSKLLTEVFGHLEDAFVDEDVYDELVESLEDLERELEDLTVTFTLTQTGDIITGLELSLLYSEKYVDNEIIFSLTLSDIGTTELDMELFDKIIDKVMDYDELYEDYYASEAHIGTIDGQSYTNTLLGIGAEFGNDWVVATQEEGNELLGMGSEAMGVEESLEELGMACDLYAVYTDGRSSINITVQESNFMVRNMSDEEYMQAALDSLRVSLKSAGLSGLKVSTRTIEFAGEERQALTLSGNVYGITLYETVVLIRTDDYNYTITAGCYNEDRAEEFLDVFFALD